jgi:hypothetical protein
MEEILNVLQKSGKKCDAVKKDLKINDTKRIALLAQ